MKAMEQSAEENKANSVQSLNRKGFFAGLHPKVIEAAGKHFAVGNYRSAVSDICIALDEAVQLKSGLSTDGRALMQDAFIVSEKSQIQY